MTDAIDPKITRAALAALPEGASHGESPELGEVYLPRSHVKAMDPDSMLVTGMRGTGKTFWWNALQNPAVRELVHETTGRSTSSEPAEIETGFGLRSDPNGYPDKDMLKALLSKGHEPRTIWRTVLARRIAPDDHRLWRLKTWPKRLAYVENRPEAIAQLLQAADETHARKGRHLIVIFDALDRCSDDWSDMHRLIRGLIQMALDIRPYRRLRAKVFLRIDQMDHVRIFDFPDASKVLSSSAELRWPPRELYGLLWHHLINAKRGHVFRAFLELLEHRPWRPTSTAKEAGEAGAGVEETLYQVPRRLVSDEEIQRSKFHAIAGPWIGRSHRRGSPHTWIPNHLGDTEGRVSPRSFLTALKNAAEKTDELHPDHEYALHFESIKHGVEKASRTRVAEIEEDDPWTARVLEPLAGMKVPCDFEEIEARWKRERVLEHLIEDMERNVVKRAPLHIENGADGIRHDLESLSVFMRLSDGRVNVPNVFRIGYGLGRKGGARRSR